MDDSVVIADASDLSSVSSQSDLRSLGENCCPSQRYDACSTEVLNKVNCIMQMEQEPLLSESPKQKRQASGKFNMRKSLAWDSAFFTSEGVLDPEELAMVNTTCMKFEKQGLSIIQEDLKKSFESSTTLDTESWTTDNLDAEIFGNIRDSIQKSCSSSSEASSSKHSNNKSRSARPTKRASLRFETSPRTMKTPPLTSKKPGIRKQGSDGISKRCIQAPVVSSENGCKILSKPPRVTSRVAMPNEKPSIPIPRVNNNGRTLPASGNCHPAVSSKTVVSIERNGVIPKSPLLSTPSSGLRLAKTLPTVSRFLYSKSGGTTPDMLKEISGGTPRKKVDSRTNGECLSSSIAKSPLIVCKGRPGSKSIANHQGYLKSTSKLSSISPNSSMDSAVSVSPSSSTSARTANYSTESSSFGSFSCVWSSSESNTHLPSGLRKLQFDVLPHNMSQEGNSVKALHSPQAQAFSGDGMLNSSPTTAAARPRSCGKNNSGTRGFRPSGLRLPSPKIGYFDADKSLLGSFIRGPQVSLQSTSKSNTNSENVATVIKSRSSSMTSLASMDSLSSPNARAHAPVILTSPPSPKASGIRWHLENSKNVASNCQGLNSKYYGKDEFAHDEVLKVDEPPQLSTIKHPINQLLESVEAGANGQANSDSHMQSTQISSLLGRESTKVQSPPVSRSRQTGLTNSPFSDLRRYGKENVVCLEDARRGLEREVKSEDMRVIEIKQLEKRLSSLKLSLSSSSALENSSKIKSLLSTLESSREVDDRNTLALPTSLPFIFDIQTRTPLVDSNCN